MKKRPGFSVLFTSILMVLSAVSATWAATETEMSLTYDDDDGSYYVNMPYLHDELIIGTLTLTANDLSTYADPSTGEISFKVYDDGGKSETYSADPASVLQIIVPEGYVLTLNGQIMTESINLASGRPYAYLNVYDAPTQNEEALIAEYVNSENVWGAVGPYVSTSNAMTLYFTAWDVLKDGLDLTVGVHQTHAITVNTLVAGGVVSGMTSAYENQTATLTATPENGYAFVKAVVIDGDGNSVDVTRSGNTFSFAMPTSDVTVTPYFADPTVLSFDENGCLNNGTHFHVECENSTCTISQGLQDNPQEGVSDFRCWSDLQQHIDGDEGLRYSTIVLGESLNLGGYDEENAKCRMSFVPLGKNQSFSGNGHSFNGNDHTIENFCYIGENSAGFFEKSNSSLMFERVTFKNAYVATTATTGYERAGVLGSEFGNATFSDITIDGATVTGSVVGGVAGNITGMQSLEGTISNVVVKNSTISASINGGALAGVAYIYMSESSLFTDNTITGTGNLGGVVGKLEGAYGGKPVSVSGTSITTSSNTGIVGGFAAVYSDSTAYVMGGERGIIQQFSFEGSLSGGSMVGGIFGRVALSSVRYMIKNCYSVGDISGTGADTDELGYIIGSMYGSPTESDSIYNNYHSGSDEVELGIGGSTYTAELWSAGSGSVFSNVRNAFGSLTANTLGYHKIDWYDNGNEGSSVDFFAGTVGYYEAVIRTVNGVVAETDMASGLLAAMMNYNLESKGESAVWISKSNSLPTFATSSDEPNHMVVVVARGLPNPTGLESVNESYLKDNGDSEGGTVAYGFTAYTDATGSLASTKFEDVWKKIEAIQENYRNDAILVDNDGNIVSASTPINSYQVWHFTTPSTYDVVYKYCISATNCVPFENVTTTALGFMTPKIDSYAESAEAPLQLVPNVVDYSEVYHTASGLKFTFELQDESGNTIQGIASGDATPQGTEFWSFQDIAQKIRAAGIEDAKTIVLKYSSASYGNYPMIAVSNPKQKDFQVDVYGYDMNSSMVQMIYSSASAEPYDLELPYGAGIRVSSIGDWRGFKNSGLYSVTYQYNATLDGCTAPALDSNGVDDLFFGTVDALTEKMGACGTVKWTVSGLDTLRTQDLVILDSVKKASFIAQRKYGNTVTEKLSIVPDYSLVNYNVSFNFNLPEGKDLSTVFLGRSWYTIDPSKMTFEGPNFPKIYTSKCPTKLAWSPTEDASEVSSWYFEQEYYKDYMNSTFLYYNPPTGDDSSTTAYVYWNTDENCEDPETINLEIRADDEGASYGAAFVLKQKLSDDGDNVTYIEHPVTTHLGRGDNDTYGSLKLPVADDTMSFIMSATPDKGFEISEIKYTATEKTNSEIGENSVLGWNGSDSTLTVNTALLENLRFNVTFSYVDFNVGFVRPTDAEATGLADVKVFVPDEYQGTELSWFDSKAYTIASSGIDDMLMPILYAKGGCVAWSKDPSYTAGDVVYRYFDNAAVEDLDYNTTLYPVYFTSADFVSYDVSLSSGMGYEVGYDDLCGDSPTGTFTVTANVNTAEGLTRMELWQIIGAEGENSHADTIKNVMTQDDQNQNLYTLEIPKVTYTDEATGDESVVPFTFEIHAVPAEGYTTYKDSYYKKNAEDEKVTIANGKLTTTGNDEVFHVDLIVAENYNLVFETEGLNYFWYWMAGLTTPYHFYYNLYITDEDRESLPEAYELGETAQKLPILHAVGFGPNNSSGSYTLLGWTMYADSAYCIAGSDRATSAEDCIEEDSPNLFKTYSGDMVVAIQASGITLDENKTVKLYPVWNHVRSDAVSNILVRCPADVDGCSNGSPIDRPMTVTLSQTFNAGGQQITLTNVSEDKATMYATYPNIIMFPGDAYDYNFTIDVSYKANAGYKFSSIDLKGPETKICQTEDADECMIYSDGTLRTKHAYSPMGVVQMEFSFVPHELSFTPYTLTFDISSLDSEIVAFGQSWYDKVDAETGKAVMNVGTANEFPNLYALHSGGDYGPYSFNEVYWTKEQAPENETEWNAWYGTYITSSMKQPFNSDLVTQYFGENSTETAMAAYPMIVSELINGYDARDAWPIWFRSDNDSDPKSYHGSVVISQTWNGKTYKQKSQFTAADAHTYLHRLFVPDATDDTLVYNVSLEPDPGYAMTLKDYIEGHPEYTVFGWSDDDGGSGDPPEGEGWGFNLDPEVMTLKVQPSRMSSFHSEAYVSFTVLHYNVEFSRPTDAEVFVASKWVSDNKYEVDWFESQTDVTVNNIKTPILYDENGCQVYWKVKDSEAHVDTGIVGELVYMTSTETLETAINVLVPDTDESNRNCDNAETYKQTLTVEGEGTILLEQVIGDAPESPEDPAQVVLAHSFVEDEATGVLTLNVPAAYNEVGPDFLIEQTGVKFRVVAVPAENYTLDKISYETAKNGNVMTVTVEDSAEVNVMESLPWTVKFKSLAPIYVTYDLSLVYPDDSADTYLPTNATKSEKLELANNADTVVFWKPYRASTCFQGWSTTAAANYTADDSAYTTFNAGNFTEFSTNPDNPTTLYAIWGDDCPETRNIWTVENGQMNATLVLYQLFGDDTLFHEVSNRRGVTLEGDAFDVYVDPVKSAPKAGYHYAADAKYELSYQYALPVTEGSDPVSETVEVEPDAENGGVWHLTSVGIPSTPTYTFKTDVEMMNYLIVFDVNAGDAPVFYGTDWVKEKTLTLGSGDEDKAFPQDLRRTDACFEGWVIPGIEEPEIYSNFDEVVDALKDVMATVETVQNDEGESVDHTYYTLSAQWNSNCTPETFKIFSGMTEGQGTFQVSQNPDAENAVWMEVPEDGLVIPELEGLSLAVKFTGADTYETGDVITGVKADAENAEQLFEIENGESFTVVAEQPDVKLNVEANLIEMNIALDAGFDDVFYGPGFSWNWSSDGVAFGAALPTNLYRAGYKLAGWKFDNEETPMLNLNEDFAAAYSAYAESHGGDYPDTLHAVWTVSGVIPAYSLQLTEETLEQNAGVLTLSQTIGDSTIVHVFEDGMLDVPMVEDLALTVNFAIDTAHSFDGETPITLKSYFTEDTFGSYATGDEVVVHTETLGAAGTVMVNVATKVDSYEFAFDINVGEDDQVFYGKDWFASKSYDMSEEELDSRFPASAYQTQNCLGGFAFTAMEPLEDGYTITMPDVKFYTGIDSAFIADYKALEEKPTTLYAVWLKPGVHCSAITSNVMISALNTSEEGEFTLTNADMEIKLPASEETAAVQVPVADDLEFTVTFTPTSAYDFDAETGTITISLVDGYDYTLVNAKTYSFAKNATLKATPTLKAVAFDLNANAGEASVFYGKEYAKTWTSEGAAYGAELPKNIYRADAKFVGWAFAALEDNTTEGFFTKFDKDFMDAYAAQETVPTTLYAVWKTDDERATYKIASASTDAGDLLVAQFVGEDSLGYAVTAAGLTVPAESDLEFKAYFTVNMEHTLASVSQPLTLMNADEEETPFGTIANGGAFTLQGNTSIVANTSDDAYEFAFDVNAGDATVFYGTNWVENLVVEMTDATASRDFPTSIYRTDKCLQGFSFDSENQETYYEGITEEFVTAFKDGAYSSPKTLYAVWGDCPDDHKNVSVTVANTAAEGWFSLGNYVGDIENEFDLNEDHESLLVPVADDLEFTVSFVSGGAYTFNGVINVLDADAETPTLVKELHSTDTYTFKQNVKLQAVTEFVKVELVFDLNVDDANVFFTSDFDGLTWNVNDYGDEFPSKIVRADKVFAGWGFTRDAAEGFTVYDNDFVVAYNEFSDSHDLTNAPVTLYALWIDAPEAIETYHVSLQNSYDGKLTLSQSNAGVVTEYEVGADGIDIPVDANREFRVTFDADYAYSLAAGTPITISEISSMGNVTDETSIANGGVFEFDANSVISVEMGADKYILAFDANKAANDTVFYNSEWSATKSYDLADEEFDYHFPTAYQTSKCLAGFAFSKTATESEAFQEVGVDFIKAYKALDVKPTTLYAVWTTEDCNHGYVVLRSGNTEAEGSFTISDAINSYELPAGSLMAVPTHVVDFKVTFHEGHAYELENIDLLDDDLNSYSGFANGAEYSFDMNTVLKANVEPKSKGLVFALNAEDATVFYGTSYDPKWFENLMNGDFYNDNLPSGIYRNDAVFMGWSFTQMSGVAEGSKYFTKIDDDFYEAFKNHAETRENFDTPDTLYAVWKSAPNREIYTVTVGNKASEGKFRLTNASGGLSNEFLVDATTMLVIPAENDLVFTVSFVSASETAEYEGISVISTTGTQIAVIEMGDEYTFRKDVMLRAISYMPTMEFALDVNAGDADVFYESDFGFKWWASSYGQYLPTGIYRTDAKLVGWSLDKNATPDKAFKEIDDAFNEAVESYMEQYGEGLIGDVSEGDFDLSKIQEMYGMDFAQMSRGPVLYAVWEKANVKTVSVKSNSLRQGTLTLQQLVDDSTFTFVVGEKGLKVPYVEGGLEFRAHFEANESHLLNSGKSLVWNAAAADTTKNDEFVLVSEATSFEALVKVVGFNLAFNAESKETLFYGDDWTSGKKVIAKGTSASQFPTMVYSASRCLVGWTLKNDVVAYTEMQDELANKLYEKYPKLTDTTKINMYALWSDSPDQCSALMTRVSVEQDKGEVMLVEKTGESNEVVHKFNEKGSMMLPSDIVSAEWTLRSAPDSSYALDSLTIVRNDKLLAVLREGGNLPGNMDNAVFKAHFSKANKTPVEIVERHFAQSGNAIQLNIKASEFEVTRGVEARVRVFDVKDDSVVLDSLLGDSVAMGFESEVVLRMKRTGDYKVVLTLEDEKESDAFEQEFGVKSSIASVGKDGWQMVSLAAVDTSAINWTSDDQVFYWWDEFGNGGDYWQYKRYNRGDSVVATRGAWYSSLDSLPLVLKRDIEDDGEDAVWKLDSIHSGWNLVANTHGWEVSLFAGHADEEKDVDEESEISFYRYNSETADYEETKYLKPYEAVWAKVGKKKNWKVSAAPVFAKATELEPQPEKPEGGRMLPKRVLAKASTKDRWVLQAVLSDKNGKQDAWNILGAGNNPFSAEEPPESMGDHVNLSIVEGKRALAKSIKSASDEMEWTVALSASNDRVGYLTLVGIDDVNAFGYRVFVTVDGNTTEMKDGVPLQVLLKSNAKTATVRVAPAAKVVAQNSLKGLRSARLGGKLKVSFEATGLAGTNARVDLLDMKGHVMSTVNAKTLEGTNALVLDAPKSGLYMLRVRAGSQQQAAKVMVK